MTLLTLVRHGETDWNRARRVQGSTDIPLNDTGREQARELAERLHEQYSPRSSETPIVVASSDMLRARETAEIIAGTLGVAPPTTYPGFRERGYGEAEGASIEEIRSTWADWSGITGAEPLTSVRKRSLTAIQRSIRDARRMWSPQSPDLIVVAHGALIGEIIRHATAGEFPRAGERLANVSTHTFLVERDRLRLLSYAAVPIT